MDIDKQTINTAQTLDGATANWPQQVLVELAQIMLQQDGYIVILASEPAL